MKLYFAPEEWKFGDFDLIEKDGKLFCIFIKRAKTVSARQSEQGNSYGLASSEDGLKWNFEGEIKRTNPDSAWDSGSLWSMCVFRYEDKFAMLYSGVSTEESDPHPFQQFGLSFSDNLKDWTDHKNNPVITNKDTGDFYHPKEKNKFAWRDPTVYTIDNTHHCIFAAKDKSKDYENSACVAHFTSENLTGWTIKEPIFTPGNIWELETPHINDIESKFFLTFGTYPFKQPEDGVIIRYATADSFLGSYTEPDNNSLAPTMCFAERIIRFKDNLLLYHWIRDKHQGKLQTYLAPPKVVDKQGNHLLLKKHPELDNFFSLSKEADMIKEVSQVKNKRLRFSRNVNCENVTLSLRCKDEKYSKNISFTKKTGGLSVKDTGLDSTIHDYRTIPIALEESCSVELFIEDRFLEVYIDGYFVYSVIMESYLHNIDSVELE